MRRDGRFAARSFAALLASLLLIPMSGVGIAAAIAYQVNVAITADKATYSTLGEVITFDVTVRNTGDEALTDAYAGNTDSSVVFSDPDGGGTCYTSSNKLRSLAPAATFRCKATYRITQQDLDLGLITNQFTAFGSGPGTQVQQHTASPELTAVQLPAIDIVKKAAAGSPFAKAGDAITYSLVATNTGNVTLTNVQIVDPKLGTLTGCTPALGSTLAPMASMTCSGSYTVTQADVDVDKVDNTASAVGTPPTGPNVTATDSASVPGTPNPKIDIVKTADPKTYVGVGEVIKYTLVATNTGNVTLTNVVVSDPKLANLVCDPANPSTLAPGAKTTCTGQYTITQADVEAGQVRNTAKVTGTPPGGRPPVTDEDSAVVTGPVADLAITKTHTSATVTVGQNVSFTLTVRNLGPSTSYGVKVTDTLPSQLEYVSAGGAGWTCSHAAQVITCELGSPLAAGASSTIDVVTKTVAAGSAIVNVAVVESRTPDPNLANNRAEDVVGVTKNVIVCPADTVQKVGKLVVKGCRDVNVRALCKVSKPSAQGSLSYCRVKRVEKNGNVKVLAKSQYPVRVRVVWYAPATAEYQAFRKVKRFTLKPNL